ASGIGHNVNALARVGLFSLRKGMWKDQRVLSEAFVQQVHTPLPENAGLQLNQPPGFNFPGALTDYGVLWWTNKSGQMANVPTDAYWAWGLGEALIVVIPSLDLVIVRNGGQSPSNSSPGVRAWNDDKWDGEVAVLEPFLDPIIHASTPCSCALPARPRAGGRADGRVVFLTHNKLNPVLLRLQCIRHCFDRYARRAFAIWIVLTLECELASIQLDCAHPASSGAH